MTAHLKVKFMLWLLVACLLSGAYATERPNVIVLLADDLGYSDIGSYGGPVHTPRLDALADEGVLYERYYAPAPVCSPSRATLLTGRHHIRSGVYSWIHNELHRSHLLKSELTLPEVLKWHGYDTAHFGKWHLGMPTSEFAKATPLDHGFDYWFGTENNAQPSHRDPTNFLRNGDPVGDLQGYACQLLVDDAIRWMDTRDEPEQPFFLNIWFHEPHEPLAAPDEIVLLYGDLDDREAIYSATIDNTDRAIGRLVDKLKAIGAYENTLIIYSSDNGSYINSRNLPFLHGKTSINEGGIRVPGIISWPAQITAGRRLAAPSGMVDILPTVSGLLGITLPPFLLLDGVDQSAVLRGGEEPTLRSKPFFRFAPTSRPIVNLLDGDYQISGEPAYPFPLVNLFEESLIPQIRQGQYQDLRLFNLLENPFQRQSLAQTEGAQLESLTVRLYEHNHSVMLDGTDWSDEAEASYQEAFDAPRQGYRHRILGQLFWNPYGQAPGWFYSLQFGWCYTGTEQLPLSMLFYCYTDDSWYWLNPQDWTSQQARSQGFLYRYRDNQWYYCLQENDAPGHWLLDLGNLEWRYTGP